MLISTKGRYALRVLADIAEYPQNQFVPLKEIAQRQEISEKYLETIVKTLVQEGVLEGLRGKGGGYRLSKAPDQFRVGDILRMMEGSLAPGGLPRRGGPSPATAWPRAAPIRCGRAWTT